MLRGQMLCDFSLVSRQRADPIVQADYVLVVE
jgi:hypothetical protein